MQVLLPGEPLEGADLPMIYLAGPLAHCDRLPSWRERVISLLRDWQFSGTILNPECRRLTDLSAENAYTSDWSYQALASAAVILFWFPEASEFRANWAMDLEFGFWLSMARDRVVYGREATVGWAGVLDDAYRHATGLHPATDLPALLRVALDRLEI